MYGDVSIHRGIILIYVYGNEYYETIMMQVKDKIGKIITLGNVPDSYGRV